MKMITRIFIAISLITMTFAYPNPNPIQEPVNPPQVPPTQPSQADAATYHPQTTIPVQYYYVNAYPQQTLGYSNPTVSNVARPDPQTTNNPYYMSYMTPQMLYWYQLGQAAAATNGTMPVQGYYHPQLNYVQQQMVLTPNSGSKKLGGAETSTVTSEKEEVVNTNDLSDQEEKNDE